MTIKGSTNREDLVQKASMGLEMIGTITKGAPRTDEDLQRKRPGQDLDYFLFRLKPKYDERSMHEAIEGLYGAQPKVLSPVQVLGRTYDEAFPTHMEAWGKSGLMIRCDSECQNLWWDRVNGKMSDKPIACAAPHCECKRIGRLFIVLPALSQVTGVYGQFMLLTHSIRDTEKISARLHYAENLGYPLYQIPFVLSREPELLRVPMKDKETSQYDRREVTKHLISLNIQDGFISQIGVSSFAGALPATVEGGVRIDTRDPVGVGNWANKKTVDALCTQANEKLGLTTDDIVRFTGFKINDYPQWNNRFIDIAAAAKFLKEALNRAMDETDRPADTDEEQVDTSRDDQRGDIIADALAQHKLSVQDMVLEADGSFRIAIVMGVTQNDVKVVKAISDLVYLKNDSEYIWVKLKGE